MGKPGAAARTGGGKSGAGSHRRTGRPHANRRRGRRPRGPRPDQRLCLCRKQHRGQCQRGLPVLVIGGGKANCRSNVTPFWDAIAAATGQTVAYVNGPAIATVGFSAYEMLAVVSDENNTSCGLTAAENQALATRQTDIADFVNAGGGLLGFSSGFGPAAYAYLGGFGGFTVNTNLGYSDITPTAAGSAIGITNALDVCCWHDGYLTFPSFLSVLAVNPGTGNIVEVALSGATDPDGDPVTLTITGVTQDEALNGLGDGDTAPDAEVGSASNRVRLRAERSGTGDGRVYRIAFTATDPAGATCSGVVTVGVPHDQRPNGAPVDSGLVVNSFGP